MTGFVFSCFIIVVKFRGSQATNNKRGADGNE
jgi:hypothetical protein